MRENAAEDRRLPVIPHVEQYVGFWAMHESAFRSALNSLRSMDLHVHVEGAQSASAGDESPSAKTYSVTKSGVAVIELLGGMTKYGSSLSRYGGSVRVRRSIRLAVADKKVQAILLQIDSPGGSVAGTGDLANDVSRAAAQKPLHAFIEDMGASAAYWVASQARRIVSTPSSLVGSIGTYGVIDDWQGYYLEKHIKTHVIRAGQYKGAGVAGTEITPDQLADWQREINEINDVFVAAVAKGRGMGLEKVRTLADGRAHVGVQALQLGLIDRVAGLDEALEELEVLIEGNHASARTVAASHKETAMSNEQKGAETAVEEVKAATVAEMKAAFPDSDAEFREGCQEANCTIEMARQRWAEHVQTQNKQLTEQGAESAEKIKNLETELAKAKAASEAAADQEEGGEAVENAAGAGAGAADDDERLKAEYQASSKLQAEFGKMGGADAYVSFAKAKARGAVRIAG